MASPEMPWSVKGVGAKARAAAKAAAAAEGLTIGAWLERTIKRISELERDDPAAAGDVSREARALMAAIETLSARIEATGYGGAATLEPLHDTLADLLDRLEKLETSFAPGGSARDPG